MVEKYRGYEIDYWMKPIPIRCMDFGFAHEDFDGAEDSGDNRYGYAGSLEEAREMIDEQIAEDLDERGVIRLALFDTREVW